MRYLSRSAMTESLLIRNLKDEQRSRRCDTRPRRVAVRTALAQQADFADRYGLTVAGKQPFVACDRLEPNFPISKAIMDVLKAAPSIA